MLNVGDAQKSRAINAEEFKGFIRDRFLKV
jgi:hypothetical protein